MKTLLKKVIAVAALIFLMMTVSGCVGATPIEDMYALPQLSNEYFELQEAVDQVIAAGAEYLAPTSGSNRSSVQLVDIDNDGTDEAVACFKTDEVGAPLKIYIFDNDGSSDGAYEQTLVIEGEGTSIESITYVDMDGDNISEVVVGWQISDEMKLLCVYLIKDLQAAPIVRTEYTTYVTHKMGGDLGGERGSDVITISTSDSSEQGEVTAYSLMQDGEVVSSETELSRGILALSRVRTGYLNNGEAAIYVESTMGSSVITDIIAYKRNGLSYELENVTLDQETKVSTSTTRPYSVYSTDINNDGIIEVPHPELLTSQSGTTSYYILKWHSYDDSGSRQLVLTTYHNFSDGWYLALPDDWVGYITIRRDDTQTGERAVVFSYINGDGTFTDFLKIYALTGANREERAYQPNRFILKDNSDRNGTIFAAEILESAYEDIPLDVSADEIRSNFNEIYAEWLTGEI